MTTKSPEQLQAEVDTFLSLNPHLREVPQQHAAAPAAPAAIPFRSPQELSAAMRDTRYREDAAYRSDVAQRISASESQGISLVGTIRS